MDPLRSLQRLRDRHGDVFTVRPLRGTPSLIVSDPELAKQVLTAPAGAVHAGECNRRTLGWLLGESSLLVLDGKRHIDHRRVLLPCFRADRLERHTGAMRALAAAHFATWPTGEEIPTLPRLRALALDVVLHAIFGSSENGAGRALRDALPTPLLTATTGDDETAALRAPLRRAAQLIDDEVAGRRAEARREPDDILGQLLAARHEHSSGLADDEVRDELLTLIVAGTGTTANTLAWTLERVARAPDALAQATAEASRGGGSFITATIQEAMRARPAVPILARLAKRPLRVGDRSVAPGTIVTPSPLLIHHRPDIYPDPASFRPERFLERQPGTYTWMPFGGGSRRCIGAGFALLEMRVVLAGLLSRLQPRAIDGAPEELRHRGNSMIPGREASLAFEPNSGRAGAPAGRR